MPNTDIDLYRLTLDFWTRLAEYETAAQRHGETLERIKADPNYPEHPGETNAAARRAELVYEAHGLSAVGDARSAAWEGLRETLRALFTLPARSQWAIGKKLEVMRRCYADPDQDLLETLPDDAPGFMFDALLTDLAQAPAPAWPRYTALYETPDGKLHLSRAFDAVPVPGDREANEIEADDLLRLATFVIKAQLRELTAGIAGDAPRIRAIYSQKQPRPVYWRG